MIRRLSDFKDEEALDLLAELVEPIIEITSKQELRQKINNQISKAEAAKYLLKENKSEIFKILSTLSDEEEYHCDGISILQDIMTLLSDEQFVNFFKSQASTQANTSGSATENTVATRNTSPRI